MRGAQSRAGPRQVATAPQRLPIEPEITTTRTHGDAHGGGEDSSWSPPRRRLQRSDSEVEVNMPESYTYDGSASSGPGKPGLVDIRARRTRSCSRWRARALPPGTIVLNA